MGLTCMVGGARGIFSGPVAAEVAGLLDQAFGAEEEWEGNARHGFGELAGTDWAEFQEWAVAALGAEALENLLALDSGGRGVYLPANLPAVALPLAEGHPLQCASLPGLRRELYELADCCELPVDEEVLARLLDEEDGSLVPAPEVIAFARLLLAANEAMRRDCPLWLIG